ncbi:MAG: CPBP family intramembrane metalloprotease [Alphaproteobacteria bacterium]|nr:CPBP family intramembrane metalloprotease [Alphaproteobacteria bacterium]
MQNIDFNVWLILGAPAVAALVGGGGFWAFCQTTTSSMAEAGEKFKLYTWALWPAASLVYFIFVYAVMPAAMRATLLDGISLSPGALIVSAGLGIFLSLVSIIAMKPSLRSKPEETLPFLASEFRELPGLVIIAPLAEEWVFRGYGALSLSEAPLIAAALITSAAFALMHFKPWLIVYSFFVGLVFFVLFSATGNILTAIVAHAAANGFIWIWMRREASRLRAVIASNHSSKQSELPDSPE